MCLWIRLFVLTSVKKDRRACRVSDRFARFIYRNLAHKFVATRKAVLNLTTLSAGEKTDTGSCRGLYRARYGTFDYRDDMFNAIVTRCNSHTCHTRTHTRTHARTAHVGIFASRALISDSPSRFRPVRYAFRDERSLNVTINDRRDRASYPYNLDTHTHTHTCTYICSRQGSEGSKSAIVCMHTHIDLIPFLARICQNDYFLEL